MDNLTMRQANEADLDEIIAIEQESFTNPWTEGGWKRELENPLAYYEVLLYHDVVIGYVGAFLLGDEAHIGNVAIREEFRNNGYGRYMMNHYLFSLYEKEMTSATLEVRDDNYPAIVLYESLGFRVEGVRKNYYADVKRDGLIYWKRW
ncbi:ribosomal-protein-alanine N-acetyltransferase [Aedoeadaptatus ivorii]|uniref:[Ribosomal protein bS18]-alanine N-acetyltransferase n=1 Tax=Aedoeadaptatus ivorii TaxID=54006 RepID=A0A3S4YWA5_9FIRM|nr:ribosomal protein S18-alanine N-acetyltransferase [Peptoniphilus ivorii]MDQ0508315.1 ribosomal-protein-alanine N-acetyltransferase [Peptoniphilus ivorii]VEJ36289.1 ribosomal-protein-alanine N-acetyltransferase [Peptoniphilus ivorii]